jgi:hypothetical protein
MQKPCGRKVCQYGQVQSKKIVGVDEAGLNFLCQTTQQKLSSLSLRSQNTTCISLLSDLALSVPLAIADLSSNFIQYICEASDGSTRQHRQPVAHGKHARTLSSFINAVISLHFEHYKDFERR